VTNGDLEAAWAAVHDATPPSWFVGQPSYHPEGREWVMYAFDPSEPAAVGVRSREWTAVADSDVGVLLEMARCLREIGAGRVPTSGPYPRQHVEGATMMVARRGRRALRRVLCLVFGAHLAIRLASI